MRERSLKMTRLKNSIWILLACSIFTNCSDTKPFLREGVNVKFGVPNEKPTGETVLTFYALGDWGTGNANQKAVAVELGKNVKSLPANKTVPPFVVELGDNIYENGLHTGWGNPLVEDRLDRNFGEVYDEVKYEGKNIDFHIIPGNHDYAGKATNAEITIGDVMHQETTAEKLYPNWKYYPIDPDKNSDTNDEENYLQLQEADIFKITTPEKIPNTGLVDIFALDTQVLLDLYDKKNKAGLTLHWQKLQELLENSAAPWKIIIGHHPIKTHGRHGGYRSAIWYVPPIIIALAINKLFVQRLQDTGHRAYKAFRKDLTKFIKRNNVQFYLSGHEHNLQLLGIGDNAFQVISGSAGKLTPLTHKNDTFFSLQKYGFVRFDVTEKELWMDFLAVEPETGTHHSVGLFKLVK